MGKKNFPNRFSVLFLLFIFLSNFFTLTIPSFAHGQASPLCEVVSDATTYNVTEDKEAEELSFIHPAWSASIPGARWIWSINPDVGTFYGSEMSRTFSKSFEVIGEPQTATLDLATDNKYEAKINGVTLPGGWELGYFSSSSQVRYSNFDSYLVEGENILEITVTNSGWGYAYDNPAGLMFKVSLENNECATPKPPCAEDCNSSVIFIPGFEGSRIYTPIILGGEKRLWDTISRQNVRDMAMDATTGQSVNQNIYTKDVILEDSYVGSNVYKSFVDMMSGLVTEEKLNEFAIFPYDWRKSVPSVVSEPVKLDGGATYSMLDTLERVAEDSRTGQVTLIGHSNGGLVIKEILKTLESEGKVGLVDKAILVGSPQLGTPSAVEAGLHGMKFAKGILDKATIRELGENMPGFYGLLPRDKYFDVVDTTSQPFIEFGAGEATADLRAVHGEGIESYTELRSFLLGSGYRSEPDANDVDTPNVLKQHFLDSARENYAGLDEWTPPEEVRMIEVIGWGLDTVRGIRYETVDKKKCVNFVCTKEKVIDPRPLQTSEGDGTVVYLSASVNEVEKYYIDLYNHNKSNFLFPKKLGNNHTDILEVVNLLNLFESILTDEEIGDTNMPEYVSRKLPDINSVKKGIRMSVHSPIELHLYDSAGRHTGRLPNIDPENQMDTYEEQIPNSYYWQMGEGQYAGVDAEDTTEVQLIGTGAGTFDLVIEEVLGDEVQKEILFENIPVGLGSLAKVALGASASTPTLEVDFDADGAIDAVFTDGEASESTSLVLLGEFVKSQRFKPKVEKALLLTIGRIGKVINDETRLVNKIIKSRGLDISIQRRLEALFKVLLKEIEVFEKTEQLTHEQAFDLTQVVEDVKVSVVK